MASWDVTADMKLEVRHYCWCAGSSQLGINTVRIRFGSFIPGGPVDAVDFADAYATAIAPYYKAVLDSSCTFAGVSIQDFPTRLNIAVFSKDGAGAGLVAGNDAPSQASGLISFRTMLAGRKGRGRIYVPFPSVTSNGADGLPITAYTDALGELADTFIGPEPLTVGTTSIAYFGVIVDDKGVGAYKDIAQVIAQKKWATQRRRGSYGRKNELPLALQ